MAIGLAARRMAATCEQNPDGFKVTIRHGWGGNQAV